MKQFFRKSLSTLTALALLAALSIPAAASDALGEDLSGKDTLINTQTQLSTNVFWSTTYSDLRTENLVTYVPNGDVTPMVTFGQVLTQRSTVSSMAKTLEAQGYRVVAGINGDFYNTTTGLPIGIVVTDGILRSSDAGYYAIGFRADGSAVLGKPAVQVSADLGYSMDDGFGTSTQVVRQIAGVNKARVTTGGIFLYTYEFNDRHTTGTTEMGVNVVCTVEQGELAIGSTLTARVERVEETAAPIAIGQNQIVLSANSQSDAYYVNALRSVPVGTAITLTLSSADSRWNEVEYAVGALYSLVENGQVVSSLPSGTAPRTAIGQKSDGTVIFYTIDGRKSGHSIGASLTQVAQRLIELGCVTALCLDGGGSTTLSVTTPDATVSDVINTPSEGSVRAVSNQVFLVADSAPTGQLSHFYVSSDADYVLCGSKVNITASAVDTNYIPLNRAYTLTASSGTLEGNVLTTPNFAGEITVTASGSGKSGSTTLYAVETPDTLAVKSGSTELTSLTVTPGSKTALTPAATYQHLPLHADAQAVTWSFAGECGSVDEAGVFTATAPGSGTLTAKAGAKSVSIPVTVSQIALSTIETFDQGVGTFYDGIGTSVSHTTSENYVRMGTGALAVRYSGLETTPASAGASYTIADTYTSVNLWVCGDGSGNTLSFQLQNGQTVSVCTLDFSGWRQCSVALPAGSGGISGIMISGVTEEVIDEQSGEVTLQLLTPSSGTVYLDQMVASFAGTVDNDAPAVSAQLNQDTWTITAAVSDLVDGILPRSAISVTYSGGQSKSQALDFSYNNQTGEITAVMTAPGETYEAMRITVTARDASGNIGRASVNVEPQGVSHKFSDIEDYWGATYVDFLYNAGITGGYSDGTFRPNQNISRAQFAVMLYRYLGLKDEDYAQVQLPFADLDQIAEYALPAVRALYARGVINGSTGADGKLYFNPSQPLTRAQAAAMIGRTQEKGYALAELTFTDAAAIPSYANYYIRTMVAQGIISGYADKTFKPNNNITRGQMAKILYNLM